MQTMKACLFLAVPALAFACRTTTPNEAEISTGRSSEIAAGAARSSQETQPKEMRDHGERGTAVRDAVARGDLDTAKRSAEALAQLRSEDPSDAAWNRRFEAVNAAAAQVAQSSDLDSAAHATALLAKACGDCHAALGGPKPTAGESMAQASGVRPTMLRHQWAAIRLWEGLVVPSDDAWKTGAHTLSDQALAAELLTPGKTPVPKVGQLVESVRDFGRKGEAAESADARADIYGKMLGTCASCHAWLGGGPRP